VRHKSFFGTRPSQQGQQGQQGIAERKGPRVWNLIMPAQAGYLGPSCGLAFHTQIGRSIWPIESPITVTHRRNNSKLSLPGKPCGKLTISIKLLRCSMFFAEPLRAEKIWVCPGGKLRPIDPSKFGLNWLVVSLFIIEIFSFIRFGAFHLGSLR
jgi:hypothetical protein